MGELWRDYKDKRLVVLVKTKMTVVGCQRSIYARAISLVNEDLLIDLMSFWIPLKKHERHTIYLDLEHNQYMVCIHTYQYE